ncbi:enoyl-CoA hydratase-related protein [Amycolatopsis thermalba]|uniref:Enoyl-CoA hydratase-related protein n=1 Tax=Amycolatopsis thermalba TaxID=944492 RepID=A0ABY4P0P0_9PSEU|nr:MULTISPECIES: enoyl-CoA hydratase-related protein [Amycolatopsis]UQS25912.1 enoyl-CoA hydratase-related protein [Amycolatopsis thermalba]
MLEGHPLIPVEAGHSDSTVLHVPDLGLVTAGDVAHETVHQYPADGGLGGGIDAWLRALDKVRGLAPVAVVAGHGAFDLAMLHDPSRAYALLESDDGLRCGVLFARGEHFTAGLDLADVGRAIQAGTGLSPDGGRDPWRLDGNSTTPAVAAQGWVLTLGIELLLAAGIRVASRDARLSQLEVRRGIYPFGGATLRFPAKLAGATPCAGCSPATSSTPPRPTASVSSRKSPPPSTSHAPVRHGRRKEGNRSFLERRKAAFAGR